MQSIGDLSVHGHCDRRTEEAAKHNGTPAKKKTKALRADDSLTRCKTRGYDVFVSLNYTDSLDGPHVFAKRKQLDEKWRNLSDAEKAVYNRMADVENG